MGAHQLPGATPEIHPMPHKTDHSVRPVVCRPESGDSQAAPQGATAERMDIGRDLESIRQQSSADMVTLMGPAPSSGSGAEDLVHNQGRQASPRGYRWGGGGGTNQITPPPL